MTIDAPRAFGAESCELVALIPHMRGFARSLCHDRTYADDLAQDALASAWAHRSTYVPGTNLKAWVFKILRNEFYSDHRRAWHVSQLDPDVAERTLVATSNPSAALELDDVRRAILELPEERREALTLVGVAGLSHEEAAAICDCAEGAVKSRVSRARRRLLVILSRESPLYGSHRSVGAMASMIADAEQLCGGRTGRQGSSPEPAADPPRDWLIREA